MHMLIFLITIAFTLFCNTLLYFFGYMELIGVGSVWMHLVKILAYAWPVLLFLLFQRKKITDAFPWLFSWFRARRVYVLWLLYWVFLLFYTTTHWGQSWYEDFLSYGFFYVLITNSLVEEWVYRWYFLSLLSSSYGFRKANILQSLGFASLHIPFYLYKLSGIYSISLAWFQVHWSLAVLFGMIQLALMGFILWYICKKTHSLWPAIILHSIHNTILMF